MSSKFGSFRHWPATSSLRSITTGCPHRLSCCQPTRSCRRRAPRWSWPRDERELRRRARALGWRFGRGPGRRWAEIGHRFASQSTGCAPVLRTSRLRHARTMSHHVDWPGGLARPIWSTAQGYAQSPMASIRCRRQQRSGHHTASNGSHRPAHEVEVEVRGGGHLARVARHDHHGCHVAALLVRLVEVWVDRDPPFRRGIPDGHLADLLVRVIEVHDDARDALAVSPPVPDIKAEVQEEEGANEEGFDDPEAQAPLAERGWASARRPAVAVAPGALAGAPRISSTRCPAGWRAVEHPSHAPPQK